MPARLELKTMDNESDFFRLIDIVNVQVQEATFHITNGQILCYYYDNTKSFIGKAVLKCDITTDEDPCIATFDINKFFSAISKVANGFPATIDFSRTGVKLTVFKKDKTVEIDFPCFSEKEEDFTENFENLLATGYEDKPSSKVNLDFLGEIETSTKLTGVTIRLQMETSGNSAKLKMINETETYRYRQEQSVSLERFFEKKTYKCSFLGDRVIRTLYPLRYENAWITFGDNFPMRINFTIKSLEINVVLAPYIENQ